MKTENQAASTADGAARAAAAVDRSPASAESTWRPLYRAGAVAAALAVIAYAAALAIVAATTAPPTSAGTAVLEYVEAHRTLYIVRQLLWLAPSLALMVVVRARAGALRHLGRTWAAVGGLIAVSSWAVSFAWPTTGDGSLAMVVLSDKFADASGPAARAPFIAGAEVLIALNDVPSAIGVLQTLGVLLISLLMLKGVFPRALAWLGALTGAIGVVSEVLRPLLGWAYALYGLLLFAWLIWVARALRHLAAAEAAVGSPRPGQ